MTVEPTNTPDRTDTAILAALQRDGRLSIAELSREVSLSPSAVSERVRRLHESGVILGYTARVDPARLGYAITALVRLRFPSSRYQAIHDLIDTTGEIVEAHHITGEDCFVLKVLATSMGHLEQLVGRIGGLGTVSTNVVYSSPLDGRTVLPPGA